MNRFLFRIIKRLVSSENYARMIGVNLGNNCFVPDKNTWSSEPYLITIGDGCQITMGVRIFTHGGGNIMRTVASDYDSFGKVNIGNNVYIGNNSLILPGVEIGNDCLVAAGSVVTKSIPSGNVVGGNPARIICKTSDYISRNLAYNAHTKGMSEQEKREAIIRLPVEKYIKKGWL